MGETRKAERSASGYARHIGRVGGLAFALGIGAAVLTGQAVASADTGDTGAAASSSQSRAERGPAARSHSPSPATSRSARHSDAGSRPEPTPSRTERAVAVDDTVDDDGTAADDKMAAQADAADSIPAHRVARTEARRATSTGAESSAIGAAVQTAAPTPWQRLFANTTPTLSHRPSENTVVDGVIQGSLHPDDPDSTRLRFTATRPAHGTVKISSDGTFAYTPGPTYTGQDRFTVTVSDHLSGFHIHGSAGLLHLLTFGLLGASGHRSSQTVFIGFERATVVAGGLPGPRRRPDQRRREGRRHPVGRKRRGAPATGGDPGGQHAG